MRTQLNGPLVSGYRLVVFLGLPVSFGLMRQDDDKVLVLGHRLRLREGGSRFRVFLLGVKRLALIKELFQPYHLFLLLLLLLELLLHLRISSLLFGRLGLLCLEIEIHLGGIAQADVVLDVEQRPARGVLQSDFIVADRQSHVDIVPLLISFRRVMTLDVHTFDDHGALDAGNPLVKRGFTR